LRFDIINPPAPGGGTLKENKNTGEIVCDVIYICINFVFISSEIVFKKQKKFLKN
jgi:hypothetical protein